MISRWRKHFVLALLSTGLSGAAGLAGELWKTPTDGDIWDMAPTDDLDGDGKGDLLAGAADNTVRALSSASGHVLWTHPALGDVWRVASFPDLDGDGKREAAAGTGGNEVLVISAGALLWSFATAGDVWSLAEAGDTSGDGVPDLACGAGDNHAYCLDLKARKLLWSRDLGGDVWAVAGGKDLDGDLVPDVVAGAGSNKVIALNGKSGTILWDHDTSGDVWRVLISGDVDGDSVPDVIAGTGANQVLCLPGKASTQGGPPFLWQSRAGSDVRVLVEAPDQDGDGLLEVIAGSLDNTIQLLRGKSGVDLWKVKADGAIQDALAAPDIDGDQTPDVIYSTDGSTVNAVSGKNGGALWTYFAAVDASFWSLAPLPDIDGDGLADLAAGSALNEITGLPSFLVLPPDSVTDLACVAAQTAGGPGVLLTWVDAPLTTSVRISEVLGQTSTPLGEVAAGVERLLAPLAGSADPRDFSVVSVGLGGESTPEICTATLTPPPVLSLNCSAGPAGAAGASWVLPDAGLRTLDGVRVALDGSAFPLLPAAATTLDLGTLPFGLHTVVATTVWGPWDSPTETCVFEVERPPGEPFIRGDANADSTFDISDAVTVLNYLFVGAQVPCLAALDGNGDGMPDISDGVSILNYLFLAGTPPPEPYPHCGQDRTIDCARFPPCI